MRRTGWGLLILWLSALSGCVMFEVSVTNPVAGLTTVAVAPFFNLSDERTVDGRRFAQAYFSELQKTPGFQVVPVGVVEQALHDHRLGLETPQDALTLARILGVDAVVIGAVTDYSPYYPPRIGLQVSWYSPQHWQFNPGVPTDEWARDLVKPRAWWEWWGPRPKLHKSRVTCEVEDPFSRLSPLVRETPGRSDVPSTVPVGVDSLRHQPAWSSTVMTDAFVYSSQPADNLPPWGRYAGEQQPVARGQTPAESLTNWQILPQTTLPAPETTWPAYDLCQPLMSYTRLFDGADPKLTARLRDYVELQGDLRAGGWEAYLHRSEDFIRFTAHLMVVEMLQLHGGEAQRRVVLKFRRYP